MSSAQQAKAASAKAQEALNRAKGITNTPDVVAALNAMHASSVAMYADLKADIGAVDDRISELRDDLESHAVLPPAEATG